ncbi:MULTISPECIES: glycine betaine ABC transporter substrate-binding protein [unclassified Streptomyces]|uniref:glycine betaine ABC transporter substrate-binding protein n=1 Tax=unclassified Streptomyces TaxID=2593676 RepID=UPI00278C48EA|nr:MULTISPECIES: glycine betaine ABC transporter substrate-binding protein [unclassified Streptomyces]
MSPKSSMTAALCAALLAGTALTGCTSTVGAGGTGGSADNLPRKASRQQLDSGSIAKDVDLKGARFTVGSKEFTEQQILGKITKYALEAAGAKTKDQTGLQGTTIARGALESGDIDMYWDYSGTGWTQFLQHDTPVQGSAAQFEATSTEDLKKHKIKWLGPAKFGNQYAMARAADAPGRAGKVDSISDLAKLAKEHPEDATLCGASEFLDRELSAMEKSPYKLKFQAPQVYQNALALDYVNVAKSSPCSFAEVFTTDARLKSLDLKVLDDDKGHFTTELAALTVRDATAKKYPQLTKLAKKLGDALTEQAIIKLNGMVDLEGKSADQAALYFLRTNGFIGK